MRLLPLYLLALFWAADIAANWRLFGMESVSVQVWRAGWDARLLSAAVLVMLASHLAFQWPLGPT